MISPCAVDVLRGNQTEPGVNQCSLLNGIREHPKNCCPRKSPVDAQQPCCWFLLFVMVTSVCYSPPTSGHKQPEGFHEEPQRKPLPCPLSTAVQLPVLWNQM